MHDNHTQRYQDQIRHYLAATTDEQESILRQTGDPALAAELLIAEALDTLHGHWPLSDRLIIAVTGLDDPNTTPELELLGVTDPDDSYSQTPLIGDGDEQSLDLAQRLLGAAIRQTVPDYVRRHRVIDTNPGEPCRHVTYEVSIADTAYGPLWGH